VLSRSRVLDLLSAASPLLLALTMGACTNNTAKPAAAAAKAVSASPSPSASASASPSPVTPASPSAVSQASATGMSGPSSSGGPSNTADPAAVPSVVPSVLPSGAPSGSPAGLPVVAPSGSPSGSPDNSSATGSSQGSPTIAPSGSPIPSSVAACDQERTKEKWQFISDNHIDDARLALSKIQSALTADENALLDASVAKYGAVAPTEIATADQKVILEDMKSSAYEKAAKSAGYDLSKTIDNAAEMDHLGFTVNGSLLAAGPGLIAHMWFSDPKLYDSLKAPGRKVTDVLLTVRRGKGVFQVQVGEADNAAPDAFSASNAEYNYAKRDLVDYIEEQLVINMPACKGVSTALTPLSFNVLSWEAKSNSGAPAAGSSAAAPSGTGNRSDNSDYEDSNSN